MNIIISFPHSGNKAKHSFEFRCLTSNALRIRRKVGETSVFLGTKCLSAMFPNKLLSISTIFLNFLSTLRVKWRRLTSHLHIIRVFFSRQREPTAVPSLPPKGEIRGIPRLAAKLTPYLVYQKLNILKKSAFCCKQTD